MIDLRLETVEIGDYIRRYDYTNPDNGMIMYTIIIWKRGSWYDLFHGYSGPDFSHPRIGSSQSRDIIFQTLCDAKELTQQFCLMMLVDVMEPPNMTDHRIGERNV